MKPRTSPLFMQLLNAPSLALKNVLNKFTAQGVLRETFVPTDILKVAQAIGADAGVTRTEASAIVDGLVESVSQARRQPQTVRDPASAGLPDDVLFWGRGRKLSQAEQGAASKERLRRGAVDAPSDWLSYQEQVNQVQEKADAALDKARRGAMRMLGKRAAFQPLAHGETGVNRTHHIEKRLALIVKVLRRIDPRTYRQLSAGCLAVCENMEGREPCGKFFIKARRDQRRCSPECTRQQSARESNQERRRKEQRIETERKLRRIRTALSRCPAGAVDRKGWVSKRAHVSKKWVTQAMDRGMLRL